MTTAFVLSGGGNLGAVQVGMLQALAAHGVRPDVVVGASVGAVNAAWLAGRGHGADLRELEEVWCRLKRSDIFPIQLLGGMWGFVGQRTHIVPDTGLRRLLKRELTIRRLEDAAIPLYVVATDIRTGRDVLMDRGDAVEAVCASAAIPGVFPPVVINGQTLVDGGVVNNCPISHALALGATQVWVLPCGYACALDKAPRGALATALQAITLLVQQRLHVDLAQYTGRFDLRVVPTLCPVRVVPTDFSQGRQLVDGARQQTEAWLRDPSSFPSESLDLHAH